MAFGAGFSSGSIARASIRRRTRPAREPFQVRRFPAATLIKSNGFAIDCPAEALQLELKHWPEEKVWAHVRKQTEGRAVVAVPFKGKVLALGLIDEVKEAFGDNLKGPIELTPVSPTELDHDDGAVVALMRERAYPRDGRSRRPSRPMVGMSCGSRSRCEAAGRATSSTRSSHPSSLSCAEPAARSN